MLPALHGLFIHLTQHDLFEVLCCIIITHAILDRVYQQQGCFWYTLSYLYVLGITISWLLSYKIISIMLCLAGIAITTICLIPKSPQTSLMQASSTLEGSNWLNNIIALSIQGFHDNVSLTWIIDCTGELSSILYAEISLHVYTVPKLGTIILHSIDSHTRTSTLWVNHHGYIIGINPHIGLTHNPPSSDDMLLWSTHKGAIILQSHAPKRNYSLMHKGIVKDNLSSHHAYNLMKHLLDPQHKTALQEAL